MSLLARAAGFKEYGRAGPDHVEEGGGAKVPGKARASMMHAGPSSPAGAHDGWRRSARLAPKRGAADRARRSIAITLSPYITGAAAIMMAAPVR